MVMMRVAKAVSGDGHVALGDNELTVKLNNYVFMAALTQVPAKQGSQIGRFQFDRRKFVAGNFAVGLLTVALQHFHNFFGGTGICL